MKILRPGTRRIPTIRDALLRVHRDLFAIDKKQIWVVPDQPLMTVEKMILILEDRRFFEHNGVDFRACMRELGRALTIQPHGGASTIDMQFVRTATGFREKTYCRKIYEMFLAVIIQFRYNKLEILRSYLNCAYFGSHLYGLHTVTAQIYRKDPAALTFDEAAEVAAMLVYPRPLAPTSEWRMKIARRANYCKRRYPRLEKSFDKLPRFKTF